MYTQFQVQKEEVPGVQEEPQPWSCERLQAAQSKAVKEVKLEPEPAK